MLDQPPADGSPSYRLPLGASGLSVEETVTGGVVLHDKSGDPVFEVYPPRMWDAQRDDADDPNHEGDVSMSLTGHSDKVLTITPDPDYLADPATQYPVTIDPDFTVPQQNDTYLNSGQPDTNYASAYWMRVGSNNGTAIRRGILNFTASTLKGTHVTQATLTLQQYWAVTCDPKTTYAYPLSTRPHTADATWNYQPQVNTSTTYRASFRSNHGISGCPDAKVDIDVTAMADGWASGAIPEHGLELQAQYEKGSSSEKRFCTMDVTSDPSIGHCDSTGDMPVLTMTYNSYPATPTSATVSPLVTATNGKPRITTARPTFSARQDDPDAGLVQLQFSVSYDPAYNDGSGVIATGASGWVQAGSRASWTPDTDLPSAHIRWRVYGWDGMDISGWSGYHDAGFNTARPAKPVVDCPNQPESSWTADSGTATSCTLSSTASGDVSGFRWALDDPHVTRSSDFVAGAAGGATSSISIDAEHATPGWHTLYARTQDNAYHLSPNPTVYHFGLGVGGVTSPDDGDTTEASVTLTSRANPAEDGVSYDYRRGPTDTWATVPESDVTDPTTGLHPSWPQSMSTASGDPYAQSSALTWNVADTVADDGVVQLRGACPGFRGTSVAIRCGHYAAAPTVSVACCGSG